MKKILILSSFPAPYRVDVFKGIADTYEIDLIFATDKDQNRSKDFFVGKGPGNYLVNDHPEDRDRIQKCITNLSSYAFVLAYDWYLPYAIRIIEKCIRKGVPYVINCDGAFLPTNHGIISKLKNLIKRRYIRHAQKCLASGEYASAYFRFYGAKQENIVVHPFSSLHESDMADALNNIPKDQMKKQLGLLDNKMVLSVGQFIYRKGFDILLNAWRELDNEYQLVIIGGGELKGEYQHIIETSGYKNVKLIDFVPFSEVAMYYDAADIFVLPTREDIWGLVINEAMAHGIPVVSSDRCIAACELIEDNINGYIVECENETVLQNRIKLLLETDCSAISCANRKKIKRHTIENVVSCHMKAFSDL